MTTKEKIMFLINKGIPLKTIANYSNYNTAYLSKCLNGIYPLSKKCINALENSIQHFINDLEVLKNE